MIGHLVQVSTLIILSCKRCQLVFVILLEENIQAIKNHRRMCFKGTYQLKKKEMKKTFKLISNLWMRLSMIFFELAKARSELSSEAKGRGRSRGHIQKV